MSEVLNAEVTSNEEGGLSRRRIVKGAAWSMPVIAAAIAAPAASASGGISATATWTAGAVAYYKVGGGGTRYDGTGPTKLSIKNTGNTFTGTITVTITLTPVGTVSVGIGAESLLPAAVSVQSKFTNHGSTATFSFSGNIASGATQDFNLLFHYESINPKPTATYTYTMATSVVLTVGATSLSLSPTTGDPSIRFK